MKQEIIELLKKNIENLDITNEKSVESIKKAISLITEENIKKDLGEKLDNKLNINKVIEEKVETKEVEENVKKEDKTVPTLKSIKNNVNVKVLVLAGAIALGGIIGGITLANRPKNDEKDDISSSYSQSIDNTDNSIIDESIANSEVINSEATIYENENTIYHYCDRNDESPEIEAMIQNLETQMNEAGIEKKEIHYMKREEMQELRKIPNSTWGTGQAYDMIAEMDATHAFALLESNLCMLNDATLSSPIVDYAKSKNIDSEIFNQFYNYIIWFDSEFKGDSKYSDNIINTPLYSMSEEQACRIEDLIGSVFTAMFNEKGYEEYYYVLDDISSINEKHMTYYNVKCNEQL